MPLQLDDLAALDAPTPNASGQPLMLPVEAIDEDAQQPRFEFDDAAMQELADSIRERGVLTPISVRPSSQQAGRWLLNFGARRLRGSRMVGKAEIPAYVDLSADSYDQVIENEQREPLTPLELALFVQRRLADGHTQAEIARRLGKSRQYVSLATGLIDAPDWLLALYRQGRCRGLLELYELRRLHAEHPQYVEAWVSDLSAITRDGVATLKAQLADSAGESARPGVSATMRAMDALPSPGDATVPVESGTVTPMPTATPKARPLQKPTARLRVEMDGQDYDLIVSVVPAEDGCVYVEAIGGGARRLVSATALTLRGFVCR